MSIPHFNRLAELSAAPPAADHADEAAIAGARALALYRMKRGHARHWDELGLRERLALVDEAAVVLAAARAAEKHQEAPRP